MWRLRCSCFLQVHAWPSLVPTCRTTLVGNNPSIAVRTSTAVNCAQAPASRWHDNVVVPFSALMFSHSTTASISKLQQYELIRTTHVVLLEDVLAVQQTRVLVETTLPPPSPL